MTKFLNWSVITALCFFCCITASFALDWKESAGDHFIIYFTQDENFAKAVLDKAEFYYPRIASDLGYVRYSEFWTWDKRVKIYIYPDRISYLRATGQPAWSAGMADYTNKKISSFALSEEFLETLLPHEMAHLVFRDFVGFKGEVPVWLDEGVAQWLEPLKKERIKSDSIDLLNSGALFSVTDMINLDIRKIKTNNIVKINSIYNKDGKKELLYLSGNIVVSAYYTEAVSLVNFLIERYGTGSFTDLCRQLRDGKKLEEAIRFAYSGRIAGIEELENAWLEYIKE